MNDIEFSADLLAAAEGQREAADQLAAAAEALTRLLKHDDTLALPPVEPVEVEVLPARAADEETKARRKAAKEKKQEAARKAREQQLKARHR